MIDERIKLLVQRLHTEKWIPAQAQRWIADVLSDITGVPVIDDQLSESQKRARQFAIWDHLRSEKVEGLTTLDGQPVFWDKFGRPPAEILKLLREDLDWCYREAEGCECAHCREIRKRLYPMPMASP